MMILILKCHGKLAPTKVGRQPLGNAGDLRRTVSCYDTFVSGRPYMITVDGRIVRSSLPSRERIRPGAAMRTHSQVPPLQTRAEGVSSMATTSIPWGEPTWATRLEEQGERKALLRVLEARFGSLPATLIERIEAADGTRIEQLLDRAGTASSLLELESLIAP
jgi:hypothetical protein